MKKLFITVFLFLSIATLFAQAKQSLSHSNTQPSVSESNQSPFDIVGVWYFNGFQFFYDDNRIECDNIRNSIYVYNNDEDGGSQYQLYAPDEAGDMIGLNFDFNSDGTCSVYSFDYLSEIYTWKVNDDGNIVVLNENGTIVYTVYVSEDNQSLFIDEEYYNDNEATSYIATTPAMRDSLASIDFVEKDFTMWNGYDGENHKIRCYYIYKRTSLFDNSDSQRQ